MLISITGTPGTGKTAVAGILAGMLNANMISIRWLVEKKKILYSYDAKRKTKEIDERELKKAVAKETEKGRTNIVEGNLSHLLDADYIFVLRTNPKELRRRLKLRKWKEKKIKENVMAEFLDAITIEALQKNAKTRVFEVDTSRKSAEATAKLIRNILNNYSLQKRYRRRVDWTERYKNFAVRKLSG